MSDKLIRLIKNKLFYVLTVSAAALFIAVPSISVKADEVTKIYTAEDMKLIAENPSGSFILMDDIDMKDVEWIPVDFTGTFDGNSHAILNLKITETSSSTRTTYDGNYKTYDTCFAGLFGVMENASVSNLTLRGLDIEVSKEEPCFIGSIAGFAEGSSITNCDIEGRLRLDVSCKMFGVGGIVGYGGNGPITETKADVTLICIDHDKENRDEQFMGGAYSAGYLDVDKCFIKIDGYDSDHGYVHDGGLVGMYILYPLGNNYAGYINNTRVEGMITFFEDNTDRRAYCKDFMGEVMNWTYEYVGNSSDFTRNEIKDYSKDLLPHYCESDNFTEEKVDSTCEEFGYTIYKCNECNEYSYKADYTLKNHTVNELEVVKEATTEEEGLSKGVCANCGAEVYITTPKVEEVVEEEVEEEIDYNLEWDVAPFKEPEEKGNTLINVVLVAGIIVSIGLVIAIIIVLAKGTKKRKR